MLPEFAVLRCQLNGISDEDASDDVHESEDRERDEEEVQYTVDETHFTQDVDDLLELGFTEHGQG